MSELKKIRVQHVSRGDDGLEVKTDVDVLTDASAVTMDGGDLITGIGGMIDDRIEALIDGAPEELDTLKEIADELSKNQSGVSTILKKLGDKVDKVTGKDLSTNNFTNTYKSKLDNLTSRASGNEATTSNRGYMSASDKTKLDNMDPDMYVEKSYLDSVNKNLVKGISIFPHVVAGENVCLEVAITNEDLDTIGYDLLKPASQKQMGLMSERDKKKLDDIDPSKYVTSENLADFKRCKVLTQSEYDALSSTEKNRADTLYFIKK